MADTRSRRVQPPVQEVPLAAPMLAFFLLLALTACGSSPRPSSPAAAPEPAHEAADVAAPQAVTPAETVAIAVPTGQRAAAGDLLRQASQAAAEGDTLRAQALLQRAQRLDPTNPDVYLALANSYRDAGQPTSARAMAERGLLFCSGAQCDRLRELAVP